MVRSLQRLISAWAFLCGAEFQNQAEYHTNKAQAEIRRCNERTIKRSFNLNSVLYPVPVTYSSGKPLRVTKFRLSSRL